MSKNTSFHWLYDTPILFTVLGLFASATAWCGQHTTADGIVLEYQITNGTCIIGSTNKPTAAVSTSICGRLRLPDVIEDMPVTDIGPYAFSDCSKLTEVDIPASVTNIDAAAFRECRGLKTIVFPSGLVSIGTEAFRRCSAISSLELPNSLRILNSGAFAECRSLRSVVVPSSVETIGEMGTFDSRTFESTDVVGSISGGGIISGGIPSCWTPLKSEYGVFEKCDALTSVTLGDGIKMIGPYTFIGCSNLTEVIIPTSVTNINEAAFRECRGLKTIVLPSGLVSIGTEAFRGCSAISSLELPNSLRVLNGGEFAECSSLRSVIVPGGVEVLGNMENSNVISGSGGSCSGVGNLLPDSDSIEPAYPSLKSEYGAFEKCDALASVTIEDGVKSLGFRAFSRCRSLTSISLPNSLESISSGTFSECPSLRNIRLPSGVCTLGDTDGSARDGVFFRCTGLSDIQVPASVTNLGDYAFAGCVSLKTVVFNGDEPTASGWNVFTGTPTDLIVSVRKDALGWYDKMTFGALATWNGRTVVYDGEILAQRLTVDDVAMRLNSVCTMLATVSPTLTDSQKWCYAKWGQALIQSYPECLPLYADFLKQLDIRLTDSMKASLVDWSISVATPTGDSKNSESTSSDTPDNSSLTVAEARLTVTNVVMHYVQTVEKAPTVEALPADGLVAVISEVNGSEAIPVPSNWADCYPRFTEMFGTDFVAALMKPTGKIGINGTPLLVWQDYVAGTDPTDPTSKFSATIAFEDGHPVITWSPNVDNPSCPRVYRVFGKKSLGDIEWTELPKENLDGYSFFKVSVEMQGRATTDK